MPQMLSQEPTALTKEKHVYVGIDPGASGGIAYFVSGKMYAEKISDEGLVGIRDQVIRINSLGIAHWVIEDVHGYMGPNRHQARGSAMFNFGENKGWWKMAITFCNGFPEQVPSVQCFKEMGMKKDKDETENKWKNRLKSLAMSMFPYMNVTLATADAILFAEYCRRLHTGQLQRQKARNAPDAIDQREVEEAQREMEELHRMQSRIRKKKRGPLPW